MLGLRNSIEAAQTPEQLSAAIASLSAAGSSPRWTVSTLTEVAEFFSVATSTVKQWRAENPPMPGSDAGWPLPAIFRWRLARLSGDDLSTARKRQDLELGEVQLAAKRLELAQQRSELLERDDVERVFATALIEARESLMTLVDLLATSSPPEMRNFVREETDRHVRSVLKSLQRRLESDELDRQTTTSAADGADDEPQTEGTDHAEH